MAHAENFQLIELIEHICRCDVQWRPARQWERYMACHQLTHAVVNARHLAIGYFAHTHNTVERGCWEWESESKKTIGQFFLLSLVVSLLLLCCCRAHPVEDSDLTIFGEWTELCVRERWDAHILEGIGNDVGNIFQFHCSRFSKVAQSVCGGGTMGSHKPKCTAITPDQPTKKMEIVHQCVAWLS